MTGTETIPLARTDAIALDVHFGFDGAVDPLFIAAGLHADTLHVLLTAPTEHSQKAETTR